MSRESRRAVLAGIALTLAAAFLLLWRLDVPLLWQDEAETANVASALLERGYPTPWDGSHLVTQQAGRDALRIGDRLVWTWHPWPQHLLAAAGLGLLGHGTWQARLPFALAALLSVPLFFTWRRRRGDLGPAVVATAIFVLSPTFVLFSRQSRYYPLLFLGGVWALWAYQAAGRSRRGRSGPPWVSLGLALALVFYANPLTGLAFAAGLAIDALVAVRRREAPFRPRLRAFALFAALAAPWLVLVAFSEVRAPEVGAGGRLALLAGQAWRLQYTLVPLVLWPALAWLGYRGRRAAPGPLRDPVRTAGREIELLALLAAVAWLVVALQAPLGTARYLLPLWPLAAVALAALWQTLHRRSAALGGLYLAALLLTNLFPALPALPAALALPGRTVYDREAGTLDKLAYQGRITAPLPRHLASLARRDCGPVAAVVAVGRALDPAPRLVVAGYGWESLHFYLGAPAVGPGLQRRAREHLALPPADPARADLLVPRRGWPPLPARLLDDPSFVPVATGVPDHAYENLPDLTGHRYGPPDASPAWRPLPPLVVRVRGAAWSADGTVAAAAPGCRRQRLQTPDTAPAASTRTGPVAGTM